MSDASRGDNPSVRGARELAIENVPKRPAKMRVRFLRNFDGLFVHWRREQVPCGHESCPRSLHCLPRQWRGYAPVEIRTADPRIWVPAVLELTERLYWCVEGIPLRGTVWDVYRRPGRRDKEECWGDMIDQGDPKPLRTDVDFIAAVQRRYHNQPLVWGQVPELGRPQILAPSVEPGPATVEESRPEEGKDQSPCTAEQRERMRRALQGGAE